MKLLLKHALSELHLSIGSLAQAVNYAEQSVKLADQSGDEYQRMIKRTTLADALHQTGRVLDSEIIFQEAEEIGKEQRPAVLSLYSLPGFQYCDLLLEQGRWQEAHDRAAQMLEKIPSWYSLLDIALDNLSLGRASLRLATNAGERAEAAEFLQRAVNGLRQAGAVEFIVRGLLARAEMYRLLGERRRLDLAQLDVAEAQRLAERSGMGLHLSDCHLEWARLCLATGDLVQARAHWATAQAMIERMGYHRRDGELAELAGQLGAELQNG